MTKKRAAAEVNLDAEDEDEDDIEDETPVTIAPKRKRKSSHGTVASSTPAKRANNKTYSSADRFNNLDNGIGDYTATVSMAR